MIRRVSVAPISLLLSLPAAGPTLANGSHQFRPPRYVIQDLGPGQATDLLDDGEVLGTYTAEGTPEGSPDKDQWWIWRQGMRRRIRPDVAARMERHDLAPTSAGKGAYEVACVKSHQGVQFLAVPPDTTKSGADGINKAGLVVGFCVFGDGRHAALWNLHTPGIPPRILQPPGTSTGWAVDINDAGQVIGSAKLTNNAREFGFVWQRGRFTNLGNLFRGSVRPTSTQVYPIRINRRGQVIGYEVAVGVRRVRGEDPLQYPFLWERGHLYELGRLLLNGSGWMLGDVSGLNDRGQIIGIGFHNGHRRVFLLTPQRN